MIYSLTVLLIKPCTFHLHISILVWYYYDAPEAAATQVQPPAVSQIPVLNGVPHEAEERPNPRRGGEDIDSKYLKIARAGGRKGRAKTGYTSQSIIVNII